MKKIILSLGFALSTLFAVFAANPESDFDYVDAVIWKNSSFQNQ